MNPFVAVGLIVPAFAAAGLALAAVPIIIHILNRRRYKIVDWAAMHFLMRAMKKNRRRVRFEQWLLLATRCLVLLLVGLALARPVGCGANSNAAFGGRTGLHVLVIDNSFSMNYVSDRPGAKTHLERAKKVAGELIDKLNKGGESVVILTSGKPAVEVVAKPTYDLQQAKDILNRIPVSYGATDLPAALRKAIAVGRDNDRQPNKNVYLFTDATASGWQGPDAAELKTDGIELASLYRVHHFNMSTGPQWNQAVLAVHPTESLITTNSQFGADFVATVRGFGAGHDATLQWKVDGKLTGGGGVIKPDTTTGPQNLPQSQLQSLIKSNGPHVITASLVGDDRLSVDNTRSRVVNVVSKLKSLVVEGQHGAGSEGGSGQNLAVALTGLSKTGQLEGFAAPELISDIELGNRILGDYRAVMLCGLAQVTTTEADQLQTFVQNGGTLMIFLSGATSLKNYNDVMLPRHLIPGPLVKLINAEGSGSFYFDFNPNGTLHPLLKAFAHQANTGLENAQAFGYWQVDVPNDPQLRVLNWKPDPPTAGQAVADAAITQQTLGQGRVVFVTTSANEEWITFTRKPVYTELVNELLSGSVDPGDGWMNLNVGDPLIVPPTIKLTRTPTLTSPANGVIPLESFASPTGGTSYRSVPLTEPGVYTLTTGIGPVPVAVNVPAEAESDIHTLDDAALKNALGGIDVSLNTDQPPASMAVSALGDDHGWILMVAVLILIGAEAYMAMRFGHFRRA